MRIALDYKPLDLDAKRVPHDRMPSLVQMPTEPKEKQHLTHEKTPLQEKEIPKSSQAMPTCREAPTWTGMRTRMTP